MVLDDVASLRRQVADLRFECEEQRLILSAMREGVIALDGDAQVILCNEAIFRLLGPAAHRPRAPLVSAFPRPLEEVVRSASLQRLIYRSIETGEAVDEEIAIDLGAEDRYLHAYTQPLTKADSAVQRLLVVLTDVTLLHHLENVRRDFVANVSHELKTPITSIKGFVETLLDGAIENPEDAERFLSIIARQADRLNAIFEDLLSLSRIEQEKERGIKLEIRDVSQVISYALQACEFKASEREVKLESRCDEGLRARMHPTLLEQAIVNLIDNAIKFSEPGQVVRVDGKLVDNQAQILVIDQGKGIDKSHLPRVFERFYRVERSRSRRQGGTGLGLAIVKHIIQAHGGYASVTSEPGCGSTFTLHVAAVVSGAADSR